MFGKNEFNPFLILAVVCAGTISEASKVTQLRDKMEAQVGQEATFQCSFPLFRDKNKIKIYWWKKGDREFFKEKQDPRKSFNVESRASGIFRLQRVRFGDAGVYYCRVEGEAIGNGTGTELIVKASPEPLKISQEDGSLLCKTSGFYPPEYSLAWYKNGQQVTNEVNPKIITNAEGLTEVSSYLKDTQLTQRGTVYVCKVSHSTLKVPVSASYTVNRTDTSITAILPWWAYLCGGIFLLLLVTIIILCCKFCKCKAHKDEFQMKTCVRCTQPIVAKPKCAKGETVKDNTQMTPWNLCSTEEVTDSPPKVKKQRKRKSDPMGV